MSTPGIIDFHCHHVGAQWSALRPNFAASQQARWEENYRYLHSIDALLEQVDKGDLEARVINTPLAFAGGEERRVPTKIIQDINDYLAELTLRHHGKLYALASVDAFNGEAGAREAERAIRELGLSGLFIESASGDLLLDAAEARPTLQLASELKIPVFIHPVNPPVLTERLADYDHQGILLARGTINAAALISLLHNDLLATLPGLQIVIATIGIAGLTLSAAFDHTARFLAGTPAELRQHIYIDTMGFSPQTIAHAIDLLGSDHVITGSDWPIINRGAIREPLNRVFDSLGLDDDARRNIASGNLKRLLKLPVARDTGVAQTQRRRQ
ncbi:MULTISPECIES: amidohydrolase family protein [unclassified Brenneria]|uniref:amidohydrolase family protein n=1 Tax=unclassified Brenneria TaxID=2634434 RepID=UPI0029C42952|nr:MULTISPECIES: amidohydrolase family protein [unclassified Brenneria]MDX5627196.1 amidohydrolase family protein [Brenneria sp. L3-3Z]MDX5694649.1 amidohydrolase family protein [Brenneria sp. L4-2C]